ncbi:MAG: hypothetical protein U0235_16655 [Polyangiaceae bacterium]
MHDLNAAEDDVDAFAQSMATPVIRASPSSIGEARSPRPLALRCAIGIAILSVGGSSSDPANAAAAPAPPPRRRRSRPASAAPPVTPAQPRGESPARNAIATRVEATDKTKAKKPAASAPRKSSGKAGRGPKLMKVQSSGV